MAGKMRLKIGLVFLCMLLVACIGKQGRIGGKRADGRTAGDRRGMGGVQAQHLDAQAGKLGSGRGTPGERAGGRQRVCRRGRARLLGGTDAAAQRDH